MNISSSLGASETHNLQPVFGRILYTNGGGGGIVPGVPSGDRGNWNKESLRDRSHTCLGKI